MQLNVSEEEVKAIRRLNARIQGTIGGLTKSKNRAAASRRNGKQQKRAKLAA